jgi:hypothetical protein
VFFVEIMNFFKLHTKCTQSARNKSTIGFVILMHATKFVLRNTKIPSIPYYDYSLCQTMLRRDDRAIDVLNQGLWYPSRGYLRGDMYVVSQVGMCGK